MRCDLCGAEAALGRCMRLAPTHTEIAACPDCRALLRDRATDRALGETDDHPRLVTLAMRLAGETWRVGDDTLWFEDPLTTVVARARARA